MKRKRSSVGADAVFSRSVDNDGDGDGDGELKRNMHHKQFTIESSSTLGLQSSDLSHGFRSGGSNKLDDPMTTSSPAAALSRDLYGGPIKERSSGLGGKVNVKLNNHAMGSNPVVKRKASRAPRTRTRSGSIASVANVPRLSETLQMQSWEHEPLNITPSASVGGSSNNGKHAMPPTGPCSPSITPWMRRSNKIGSDCGTRISNVGINDNASLLSKSAPNYENQNFKVNARSGGSDKTGSKALKKLADPKGFSRLGKVANRGSPDCSGRNGSMKNKNELKDSLDRMDNVEQLQYSSLYGFSDAEKRFDVVSPLYQRLLSAMISEDEIEDSEYVFPRSSVDDSFLIGSESKLMGRLEFCEPVFGVQTRKNGNAHKLFPCNGSCTDINGSPSAQDCVCNGKLMMQRDGGYVHSEVELLVGFSRCNYGQMRPEEKLVVELESVGLFLEAVPALDDKEDEEFSNQEPPAPAQLERGLDEGIGKKKTRVDKIYKAAAQGENIERGPEHGIAKVSKQVGLDFNKRTLARCRHKFEDSGASCFSEPPQFAETELLSRVNLAVDVNGGGSPVDPFETSIHHQSDQAVTKNVPMSNRVKKREVLVDDVFGGAGIRAPSALGILGGAKGKRSKRKAKLNQKTAQISMSGNAFGFMSSGNAPLVSPKPNETNGSMDLSKLPPPLNDIIDGMEEEELGVDSEIGAGALQEHDINSLLNFEVQDHDGIGLEIPNDDILELNIF